MTQGSAIAAGYPDHVPDDLVRNFDFDAFMSTTDHPHEVLDTLLAGPRIFYTPHELVGRSHGSWVLTRSADMRVVLNDHATFSSADLFDFGAMIGEDWKLLPLEMDPPSHTAFRNLLNPLFSAKRVAAMEEKVRSRAEMLLRNCLAKESFDFVSEFAQPFPAGIFVDMIGMDVVDTPRFLDMARRFGRGTMEQKGDAVKEIVQFLRDLLERRRNEPADDFATYILNAEVFGRKLTEQELMGMFFLTFTGGLDTVASSSTFFFNYLARNAQQQALLRQKPELIPGAVDELFRAYGVVTVRRYATRDVELAGVMVRSGDCVTCLLPLASRDPELVDDPAKVDFCRRPTAHFTFSNGRHFCVGAILARREMHIALDLWTTLAPPFELATDNPLPSSGPGVLRLEELPLVWKR